MSAPVPRDSRPPPVRHLRAVPFPFDPEPDPEPVRPLVRPDLMWVAVWGPVAALGAIGLVSSWLARLVGVWGVVGVYALLVAALVLARAGWGR